MEYLPFGETLVEEHLNSNNSPFRFNAKELDEETGNYYYGARYYDPKWSIWLSVDPLAEYYPSINPYSYTFNNPIKWTDSTGMCPDGDCPDGVFEDGYEHTTEDGRTYFYMAEDGTWSDGEVLIEHTITIFEKVSKWIKDLFRNGGGAQGYANGTENIGRKDGKPNMDPIDFSELPGAFRGPPFKLGKTKMGPYVNGTKYLWDAFSVGYEAAESVGEKIDEHLPDSKETYETYVITTSSMFSPPSTVGRVHPDTLASETYSVLTKNRVLAQ